MKSDISVVIPLYNKEQVIERTVKTVLHQTYQNFELVIVDDGSTDRSTEIVSKIVDGRIRLIHQQNTGPSAARNTGVKHAKTDWIVFLDGDDELLPDALSHFSKLRREQPDTDVINCRSYIRSKNNLRPTTVSKEGFVSNNLRECYYGRCMPGAGFSMYRKHVLESCPYDERIRRFEDAEFLIRLLPHVKIYSSQKVVQVHDINYAEASHKRDNIGDDYAGHLSMKGLSFWAKMCVYRTFLENRELYPKEMHRLYPNWYWRYDLLLLFKLLNWINR